ncbi:MAG: Mth938-like domain-containing protein [Rhodospirillales bacterium]
MSLDITPAVTAGTQLVQAYGDGGFRIANKSYQGSVLVLTDRTVPVSTRHAGELDIDAMRPIAERADEIDILVVGCGETFSLPSDELRGQLRELAIVMEWMDTGAACRTFNVLMTEGRRAAAVLIAVDNELG